MTHGKKNLQILLTGVVVAFAVMAPSAQATELKVCNQATHNSLGGDLLAIDGVTSSSARFTEGLKAHPGKGAGLLDAAAHSRALSACILPETPVIPETPGDTGGENGYSWES